MEVAARLGAYRYVECSALSGKGVRDVFENAIKAMSSKTDKLLLFPTRALQCCTIV